MNELLLQILIMYTLFYPTGDGGTSSRLLSDAGDSRPGLNRNDSKQSLSSDTSKSQKKKKKKEKHKHKKQKREKGDKDRQSQSSSSTAGVHWYIKLYSTSRVGCDVTA